jgi:hypothetical protein
MMLTHYLKLRHCGLDPQSINDIRRAAQGKDAVQGGEGFAAKDFEAHQAGGYSFWFWFWNDTGFIRAL